MSLSDRIAELRAEADELRKDAPSGSDPASERYLEAYMMEGSGLRDEVERLRAEVAELRSEREAYLFHEICRHGDSWQIRGLWLGNAPIRTRADAVERFIGHLKSYWDWPGEKRRRAEEARRVAEETSR